VLLAEGRAEEAVETCLDALAVSRELSLGGGLHGSQLSASSQNLTYRPCAAALDAAPVERKRRALAQLARLNEGRPSLSSLLREESVFHQLATFGPDFLPPEALSRLPPAGQALVKSRGGWFYFTSRLGHPLLRRYLWRRNVSLFDAMVAAADLPPDPRQRAFARIDADHSLLADFPGAAHATKLHGELEHLEPQRLQLEALAALVEADISRAAQGRWPSPLTSTSAERLSLQVFSEQEALLAPRDARLAEHALPLTADRAP
jgi:hypothetical protein